MPDAFFATQKPRKRKRSTATEPFKKPAKFARTGSTTTPNGKNQPSNKKSRSAESQPQPRKKRKDEELSSASGSDVGIEDLDLRAHEDDEEPSGDEIEDETPAEKRLRLAKLYLDSVKEGLREGEGDYDAAETDKEIISSRLKQDVMEHRGNVHLFVAANFDFAEPPSNVLRTRGHRFSVTSAVASDDAKYLFTSGKEGQIIKWDLRTGKQMTVMHKLRVGQTKGKGKGKGKEREEVKGHTDEVLGLALSGDGRYLASGGKDRKVVIWDVEKGEWVKSFGGHKDTISSVTFRKNSQQLYTASFDRTIKLFDLSVMGYVETLFGHQDSIQCVDALRGETAVSVGGRDRTVRFWKIVEESQLVFRGGGRSKVREVLEGGGLEGMEEDDDDIVREKKEKEKVGGKHKNYIEGSIECVTMVDENTFVSGGDSGSICLWTTQKKKPIFTQPLAHGFHEVHSETEGLVQTPRWVTCLASLRYSDLFASGSWEGSIRIWKLESNMKSFSLVGTIPALGIINSLQFISPPKNAVEELSWARSSTSQDSAPLPLVNGHQPNGTSGKSKSVEARTSGTVLLIAGVGQEMKFGRWMKLKGEEGAVNCALVFALHPRTLS
ncbi:hypothetical protein JAAARDRAFT_209609 [Jaapia argillacea MUCL 33604]|uniref:Uncharacterized protein n=1 Tax=Jaapia argillacea MUCL 33604 TaxID=933084 RepID=A0A067PV11_9AGAM|nr:hypothetical protein JAAARDRAFT_209609 [Jaapia argillacea MUCL 33604]